MSSSFNWRGYRPPYLGVDLDTKSLLRLLRAYFNARAICEDVRVEETARGFHLKLYGLPSNLEVRLGLGDDFDRVECDRWRLRAGLGHFVDTLFDGKRVGRGPWVKPTPVDPLTPPFWTTIYPKEKLRRLEAWRRRSGR
ncbi:MAG: hypothetical protein AB1665_09220 [Candidatus Thermoplasmatota archaeon]